MRLAVLAFMMILLAGLASAECSDALDGMTIKEDTTFCSDTYDIPNGIKIGADNITIDCGTAVLRGIGQEGTGITIENRKNVLIKNCNILTFHVAVYIKNSSFITLEDSALLKNRIGLRMMHAYENNIIKIADKSSQTPVSMITSKFNRFDINKPIEEEYCTSNACNEEKEFEICADDDFYCSPKCSEENDNDCIKKEIIKYEKPVEKKEPVKEEIKEVVKPEEPDIRAPKKKSRSWLLYPIVYLFAFLVIQFYEHVKKD